MSKLTTAELFFQNSELAEEGCWNWTKSLARGYGLLSVNGKYRLAHRWIYEQLIGKIPEGLQLDHLCRNRKCVNPYHLEPVTASENQHRGKQHPNFYKTHCIRGHEFNKANTINKKQSHGKFRDEYSLRFCKACYSIRLAEDRIKYAISKMEYIKG